MLFGDSGQCRLNIRAEHVNKVAIKRGNFYSRPSKLLGSPMRSTFA